MTSPITIRLPSKYTSSSSSSSSPSPNPSSSFSPPPLDFLTRTWTVTHSSLPMWRSARNVRITYGSLPAAATSTTTTTPNTAPIKVSDLVEYESISPNFFTSGVNRIRGIDTASSSSLKDDTGAWDWRGSGLLFFVTSHWEILGWGERDDGAGGKERWVVTWFQKTVFSAEGVDVYSDRREGGSEGLKAEVLGELKKLEGQLGRLVAEDLKEVEVRLPWLE